MNYKLLYEGASPPDAMPTQVVRDITEAECAEMYAAGRQANGNYSIIIEDRGARKYWSPPAEIAPVPRLLSKTAFQDLAVANLGGGTDGMIRFQEIMDECAAGEGVVKFCFSRYEAAVTFEKAAVAQFTSIMVGAGIMEAAERTAVLGDWPEN